MTDHPQLVVGVIDEEDFRAEFRRDELPLVHGLVKLDADFVEVARAQAAPDHRGLDIDPGVLHRDELQVTLRPVVQEATVQERQTTAAEVSGHHLDAAFPPSGMLDSDLQRLAPAPAHCLPPVCMGRLARNLVERIQ